MFFLSKIENQTQVSAYPWTCWEKLTFDQSFLSKHQIFSFENFCLSKKRSLKVMGHLENLWVGGGWISMEKVKLFNVALLLNVNPLENTLDYFVKYAFQNESTLYSCLNVEELLARSRHKIWSLSNCHWIQTQKHLVRKRKLNHLESSYSHLNFNFYVYLCMFHQAAKICSKFYNS